MKITPEQLKAVQSYIDYMRNLYNKPQALPPPKTKINKRTKSTSNIQEFFVDSNGVVRPVNASAQRNNTSFPHPNTRRLAPPSNAVQNVTSNNNPFYNSILTLIKDNPKTAYTTLASLFSAPVLYSMFGGSEEASSGTVPDGTNADSNNYKLLANKAIQDINKEYAAAHNKTINVNTGTDTPIPTNNGINNLAENLVNAAIGQGITQGSTTTEKKEKPVTGNNKGTGTALGNSVKNIVNQKTKKDNNKGNTGRVYTKYIPNTPVEIPGSNAAEHTKSVSYNNPGGQYANSGLAQRIEQQKIPLTEAQRDYYRYLTGYHRMSPNQAILSMGLDPTKYY